MIEEYFVTIADSDSEKFTKIKNSLVLVGMHAW